MTIDSRISCFFWKNISLESGHAHKNFFGNSSVNTNGAWESWSYNVLSFVVDSTVTALCRNEIGLFNFRVSIHSYRESSVHYIYIYRVYTCITSDNPIDQIKKIWRKMTDWLMMKTGSGNRINGSDKVFFILSLFVFKSLVVGVCLCVKKRAL